jgi:hypothetical protein
MGEFRGMADQTLGQVINTWVQTIGIVAAGCWAAYTFVYKEYTAPKSVPVNISVTLQLNKIGPKSTAAAPQDLIAIEMQTAATNPSSRDVFLVDSTWIAAGCAIRPRSKEYRYEDDVQSALNSPFDIHAERFVITPSCRNVAGGRLFGDGVLHPNETLHRTKILYVPPTAFDEISVQIGMWTTERPQEVAIVWSFQNDEAKLILYQVGKDGQRTELPKGADGQYIASEVQKLGLQAARSFAALSLWQ